MSIRLSDVGEQTWYIGFHCVVDNTTDFKVNGQGSNLGGGDNIVSFCLSNQVIHWIAYCIGHTSTSSLCIFSLCTKLYLIIFKLPFYILLTELYVYSGRHCSSWILGWDSWISKKCKNLFFLTLCIYNRRNLVNCFFIVVYISYWMNERLVLFCSGGNANQWLRPFKYKLRNQS